MTLSKLEILYDFLISSDNIFASEEIIRLMKFAGHKENVIKDFPEFEKEIREAAGIVKPTFLRWVALQLKRKEPFLEIINTIREFLQFQNRLEKKDLYQYDRLADLRSAIESGGQSDKLRRQKNKESISGDFEKVY